MDVKDLSNKSAVVLKSLTLIQFNYKMIEKINIYMRFEIIWEFFNICKISINYYDKYISQHF